MSRLAFIVAGCLAAAALITAVAYFAFDNPIAMLLPGAIIERNLWPRIGPPELRLTRMLILNVAVIAVVMGAVAAGLLLRRHRRR